MVAARSTKTGPSGGSINNNGDGTIAPASARSDSLSAILTGRVARSEVPARRYWLKFLDAPLGREIRLAGALDFDELVAAVPRILRCCESLVSRQTIQEWWEFAMRRRWLEPVGLRWGLTERARKELQEEQQRVNSPDPRHVAGGIARWVIPTSLVGFAGLASGRYLVLEAAILVMAGVIIVGLLLAAATSRATDPRTDRWFARRACDWLEGRPITLALGANRKPADFSRLYEGREAAISTATSIAGAVESEPVHGRHSNVQDPSGGIPNGPEDE
jgi:hypothetical protein